MSVTSAILSSLGICVAAAALEGVCAGRNVRSFFTQLKFPPYSAPLWGWAVIGGIYYMLFSFVLYRLFMSYSDSPLWYSALTLILFMMMVNALSNYIIFRGRNLRLSFIICVLFPIMDIALFLCMIRLDGPAAFALVPYLFYRVYSIWWGYAVWKLNTRTG